MKRQPREVYGFGPRLRTRRFPPAWAVLLMVPVAFLLGALWA